MALIAQGRFTIHRKPDDGLTPVIYSLDISDKLVSKSNAGVLTPSSVSARAVLQVGDRREVIGVDEKIDYKGRNMIISSNSINIAGADFPDYTTHTREVNSDGYIENTVVRTAYDDGASGKTYRYAFLPYSTFPESGKYYILSFEYKTNSGNALVNIDLRNPPIYFTFRCENTNGIWLKGFLLCKWEITTHSLSLLEVNCGKLKGEYIAIRKIKLEKGNIASAYTEAPEDVQIKLFSGNGQTETAYNPGENYTIKSTDKLLKWQLLLNDQLQASESTTIVADGMEGPTGSQGIPGTSSYFHVKYSVNSNGNPMQDTPAKYIGTAATSSSTPPSSYTSYKWTQFQGSQGPKGDQGIAGTAGSDGRTPYLHIKYSDNGTSFTGNNGETPGDWIGQYTDFVQADSNSFSAYTWSKIRGDKGDQGAQGPAGISGALLRPRGEWEPNTQYVNNTQYRDTVIYNKNKYIVKNTHTSSSTFDPAQWEDFNEFINVATQVLLADQAWIDILGTQGIAVGSDAANRWEITDGKIRHTATGLELTSYGKIIAPPGGITFSSGKTVEDVIKDQVDAVTVGGRNLIKNSTDLFTKDSDYPLTSNISFEKVNKINEYKVTRIADCQINQCYRYCFYTDNMSEKLLPNTYYTWSIDVCSNCTGRVFFDVRPKFNSALEHTFLSTNGTWKRISLSFNSGELSIDDKFALFLVGVQGENIGDYVKYRLPKIEKGNKPTDWSPAPEDIDYLTDAIQGDTVLNGGLVMSNVMAVRNGNDNTEESIVAGMSGLKDDGIFFFADVKNAYRKAINYFKGLSSDKPLFAVSKSGFIIAMTGLIGCFRIARDLVTIQDSNGRDKVKFTGESIEKFANSVPTMSGATLGNLLTDYNNTVGSFRQYTGTIETLSYSFNLSADTVFAITAKQNLKMEASATATESPRVDAESYLRVNYRIEVKNNGAVVIDQLIQTEYIDAITFDGPTRVNSYRDVALNYVQSQAFSKGTVEVKIYARYDMQLYSYSNPNNTVRSSAYAKIELKTGTANGLFTFVSTTDETIIGSDGLSIRLDSNNFFKLLKKAGELNMIFKGFVSPDSNIPALICGGEVDSWGSPVLKLGGDSSPYRISTGHYRITLPLYMQGKSNYIVQLTAINTDNIVTWQRTDPAANCFYVQTWQGPGAFEDAGFSFMVYRAK